MNIDVGDLVSHKKRVSSYGIVSVVKSANKHGFSVTTDFNVLYVVWNDGTHGGPYFQRELSLISPGLKLDTQNNRVFDTIVTQAIEKPNILAAMEGHG